MIPGIGFGEMIVVALVAVILFGAKLPEVARNAGRAYQQFRDSLYDLKNSVNFEPPDLDVDRMPRQERIRHYSDAARDDDDDDGVPFVR